MTPCFLYAFPQAIDSIHQVGLYCLALVPANTLPKTPLGGIHVSETKQHFLEGSLHPCNILMCPHTCVTNLPKPRQKQPGTLDLHLNQNLKNCLTFFVNMMRGITFKHQVNREKFKRTSDLKMVTYIIACTYVYRLSFYIYFPFFILIYSFIFKGVI